MLFLHNYRYGAYSILVYQYVLTHYSVLDVKRSLKIGRDRIQRLHQKVHYGLIKIGS